MNKFYWFGGVGEFCRGGVQVSRVLSLFERGFNNYLTKIVGRRLDVTVRKIQQLFIKFIKLRNKSPIK